MGRWKALRPEMRPGAAGALVDYGVATGFFEVVGAGSAAAVDEPERPQKQLTDLVAG